jgi:hypothetical protein
LAPVDTLVPTWLAVVPVPQTLTVAPTIPAEPARTVPVNEVEPVVPPDEDEEPPDEDELLLEVPPEDEPLEDELLDDDPLLEEEVPPLLDEDELLEVPPLLDEDELLEVPPLLLDEEDEPVGGGAAPPPPPPPHAANVTEATSVIDLNRNVTFSGMRLFSPRFLLWSIQYDQPCSLRNISVDGCEIGGSRKTTALSYRSCVSVLTVTVGQDIS